MKKIILFLFFGFAFLKQSNSQILREWVYDFNPSGINYGYGHGVVCDHHDNVYISGIISNGTSMLPIFIKMNNSGSLLFLDTTSSGDRTTGNLIYDSKSTVFSSGQYLNSLPNTYLEAFDTSGFLLWRKTYYRGDSAQIFNVQIDRSTNGFLFNIGNYYDSLSVSHINLIKTDSLGNLIWIKSDSGLNISRSFAQKLIAGNNGRVYCIGYGQVIGSNNEDIILICYDESGNIIWYRTIDGTLHDFDAPWDIKLDSKENILVSAFIQDTVINRNSFIAKFDTLGNEIWRNSFEGSGSRKFVIDSNDNIYFNNGILLSGDIFGILKLDSAGNLINSRNFSLPNYSMFNLSDIVIDDSSNIYLSGIGFSNTSVYDFVTYKIDSSLTEIWNDEYLISNTLGESPYALALDNSNNFYVAGQSNYDQVSNTSNLCVVKYGNNLSTEIHGIMKIDLISVFPNPTSENITIDLGISENEVSISITDVYGKLFYKDFATALQEKSLNIVDFPSGIYFVKISKGKFNFTKKIIKY